MEPISIITGLAIVAILILPFVLHYHSKKRKESKILNNVKSIADTENAVITHKEFWGAGYAIAIDDNSKKIIYVNEHKENRQKIAINLSEVEKCRVATASRNVKTPDGNNFVTDRLDLVFTFKKPDLPEKALEFYDSAIFMTTDGELPLVEKWLEIVNKNLRTVRK